jgi:hypothetical protein
MDGKNIIINTFDDGKDWTIILKVFELKLQTVTEQTLA